MFRKCILISFIFTCLISCLYAQEEAADANPSGEAFKKPVTLKIIGGEMSDLARELSKQTGTEIRAPKDIADRKLTVIVDDKPADLVIKGVMTLFGYRFSSKKLTSRTVYEFWETKKQKQQREIDWNNWEEIPQISLFNTNDSNLPTDAELLENRRRNLENPMGKATGATISGEAIRGNIIGSFINNLPKEKKIALLKGATLCFDTRSNESDWKLPDGIAHVFAYLSDDFDSTKSPLESLSWDLEPEFIKISIIPKTGIYQEDAIVNMKMAYCIKYKSPETTMALSDNAISSCLKFRPKIPEMVKNRLPKIENKYLNKKVNISFDEMNNVSNLLWKNDPKTVNRIEINRSNILDILHKKTGAQIIADHVSEWSAYSEIKDISIAEVLEINTTTGYDNSFWGSDKDFIYMLTRDENKAINLEIPNRILKSIKANIDNNKEISRETKAQLALLGEETVKELEKDAKYLGFSSQSGQKVFIGFSFYDSIPILQFYGSLSKTQRETAFKGQLSVESLSLQQRQYLAGLLYTKPNLTSNSMWDSVIVGMYKNGIRIDRPQTSLINSIDSVGFTDYVLEKNRYSNTELQFNGITANIILKNNQIVTVGMFE